MWLGGKLFGVESLGNGDVIAWRSKSLPAAMPQGFELYFTCEWTLLQEVVNSFDALWAESAGILRKRLCRRKRSDAQHLRIRTNHMKKWTLFGARVSRAALHPPPRSGPEIVLSKPIERNTCQMNTISKQTCHQPRVRATHARFGCGCQGIAWAQELWEDPRCPESRRHRSLPMRLCVASSGQEGSRQASLVPALQCFGHAARD
jgi:hypothetical protein